ncbi:hypothetical protein [Dactylosporangium sp. CA-233914]|uniref:hypothetical protein n=1 Tax=Dactylosporangium sp. CA-233914 TaxID=3239934 RepID=UPI003D94ADCB
MGLSYFRRRGLSLVFAASLIVASSCGVFPLKSVTIGGIAWLSDGRIYYVARLDGEPNEIRSVQPDVQPTRQDRTVQGITSTCTPEDYGLRALSNGAMAVSVQCLGGATQLIEYNGQSRPWGGELEGWQTAVWNPVTGQGYTSYYNRCSTLGRLGQDEAIPLSMATATGPIRVDRPVSKMQCTPDIPDVAWPLPHGQGVDVFISLPSVGLEGEARRLADWTLYRAEADGVGHAVLDGFVDIRGAMLSGDGQTLVVAAKRDGDWALWRVDVARRSIRMIADGDYGAVSLSPDNKRLAAVLLGGTKDDQIRVLQLEN